jgi:hypothetical protein
METVTSKDGTTIAFDRLGEGPPVVVVTGGSVDRTSNAPLAQELASDFSAFYRDCKVLTDDPDTTGARVALCLGTKRVISDGLGLLGVSAPESM